MKESSEKKGKEDVSDLSIELDTSEQNEEIGLFELEEDLASNAKDLRENIARMSSDVNQMGERIQEDADRLLKLKRSSPNPNRTLIKKIVDNAAKTMDHYGETVKR